MGRLDMRRHAEKDRTRLVADGADRVPRARRHVNQLAGLARDTLSLDVKLDEALQYQKCLTAEVVTVHGWNGPEIHASESGPAFGANHKVLKVLAVVEYSDWHLVLGCY